MKSGTARRLLALLTLGAAFLLFQSLSAGAAPGDSLGTVTTACPGEGGIFGIGVAFDGNNILYTCSHEAKVHLTDLTGADLGSVDTKDSSNNPVALDAIAWDANDGTLWGGNLDGAGNCRIYETDLSTGVATLKFTFNDPNCSFEFFDGLTVDTNSDTLYLSPDVNPTIRHFDKAGNPLPDDPIPFSTLAGSTCGGTCLNSGLAIGLDGTLFAGTDGSGKIVELDPTVPSFLGQFASVSGRDEDLECGPLFTKGDGSVVETILSRDALSNTIDVLEAPPGTCVVFNLTLAPASAINVTGASHTVTATLTANGAPLAGRTILFTVSGANTASGSGTSDASGQAAFTYTGTNSGDDTITACADINNNGLCDPEEPTATAKKTWVSVAPGGGSFVIGDEESTTGTNVTFWGSRWSKLNPLSGGNAPASFKGFAKNPSVPSCGTDWSTDPGNSAKPPKGPLPALMAVIVTSNTSKSGSQISGDTVHMVVVQTNPGYSNNPGHAGTGSVVAQIC